MSARATQPGVLAVLVSLVLSLFLAPAAWADPGDPADEDPAVRVMAVGDSITHGSSGDHTWRFRLWQGLHAAGAGSVQLVGHRADLWDTVDSVPGSDHYAEQFPQKSHAALWGTSFHNETPLIEERVRTASADVVLIQLGHNDLRYSASPQQALRRAADMVDAIRRANPTAKIVIGEVTPGWDPFAGRHVIADETRAYAAGLPALVAELSTTQSPVVIAKTLTGWSSPVDTYDGSHPGPSGEVRLAQAHLRALEALGVIAAAPTLSPVTSWSTKGPAAVLQVVDGAVTARWSRVSTGATGMVLRYRAGSDPWTQLPDAIGDAAKHMWTLPSATPGSTYEVQLAPRKWFMTGQFGPSARITVPRPAAVTGVSVSATNASSLTARWTVGPGNAPTGYAVGWGYRTPGSTAVHGWKELSGTSTATTRTITGVPPGAFVVVGVQPVFGSARGGRVSAAPVRVAGVARNAVQVAVGDDDAAGAGVPAAGGKYLDSCRRSGTAWVHQALRESTGRAVNLACSGSSLAHLTAAAGSDPRTGQVAKLRAAFVAAPERSGRVLISVGANDLRLQEKATYCILNACADRESRWTAEIEALRPRMRETFKQIQAASPHADRYLVLRPPLLGAGVNRATHPICLGLGADSGVVARLAARLNVVLAQEAQPYGIWVSPTPAGGVWTPRAWCGAAKASDSWTHYPTVAGSPASVRFGDTTGRLDARGTAQQARTITTEFTGRAARG